MGRTPLAGPAALAPEVEQPDRTHGNGSHNRDGDEGMSDAAMVLQFLDRTGKAPDNVEVRGFGGQRGGQRSVCGLTIQSGAADACIATRASARAFGLGFLPLVSERYDLVIRKQHLNLPAIQTLIDVLSRSGFRRELEMVGGYETACAGGRVL